MSLCQPINNQNTSNNNNNNNTNNNGNYEMKELKRNDNYQDFDCYIVNKTFFECFNLQSKSGKTAIMWAIDKKEWKCVEYMLTMTKYNLLDLTIKDSNGKYAYQMCENKKIKELLISKTNEQLKIKQKNQKQIDIQKDKMVFTNEIKTNNNKINKNNGNISKSKKLMKGKKKKMKIKLKK